TLIEIPMYTFKPKKTKRIAHIALFLLFVAGSTGLKAQAPETSQSTPTSAKQEDKSPDATGAPKRIPWQYGLFVDAGYLYDCNHPVNDSFRSRGTTFHVDELNLNMAGAYLKKQATTESRWGMELTGQMGQDTQVFGFSATAPNLPGYKILRHFGPTDVSY